MQLAVFDFDGTCIAGNSPVLLVRRLLRKKMLGYGRVVKIMSWAAAYKMRLPQNEAWVRSLVFSAFEGQPRSEVDSFLRDFYDDEIQPLFRPEIDRILEDHAAHGRDVVVASATFEPIILRAMELHPITHQVSTRMRVDTYDRYTRQVEGCAIEGTNKLAAVIGFADREYGKGNWTIAFAYGDHHSDIPLLKSAQVPVAVAPDSALRKIATESAWSVLDLERKAFI